MYGPCDCSKGHGACAVADVDNTMESAQVPLRFDNSNCTNSKNIPNILAKSAVCRVRNLEQIEEAQGQCYSAEEM